MATVLSFISGQFSKGLVLGALIPVTFFVVLGYVIVPAFVPPHWPPVHPSVTLDTPWAVVAFALFVIACSNLLYDFNTSIIRLYEGYPWRSTWIGKRRTRHYEQKRADLAARWAGMRTLRRRMDTLEAQLKLPDNATQDQRNQGNAAAVAINAAVNSWAALPPVQAFLQADAANDQTAVAGVNPQVSKRWAAVYNLINTQRTRIGLTLFGTLPDAGFVLPTSLGNVIRSFENYSSRRYGMEPISTWPRLLAKIDPGYATSIDDAKTAFDFTINCSLLSAVLAAVLFGVPLFFFPGQFSSAGAVIVWLEAVVGFVALSWFFYALSIPRAGAWGELVKGAFDLYRWDLLSKMGFKNTPTTPEAEKALWDRVAQQMLFSGGLTTPAPAYADPVQPPVMASGTRHNQRVTLPVQRSVRVGTAFFTRRRYRLEIVLAVTNEGAAPVSEVTITDTLPPGFDFEWNSQHCDGRDVTVDGTNPYRFTGVGDIPANGRIILTYRAIPQNIN